MSATLEEVQYHARRSFSEPVHAVEFLKDRGWRALCGEWVSERGGGWVMVDRAPMYATDNFPPGGPVTCGRCLREITDA